ncbi:MAG: hypothetical protein AAGA68_11905 [Pseudomonadota bacterium]
MLLQSTNSNLALLRCVRQALAQGASIPRGRTRLCVVALGALGAASGATAEDFAPVIDLGDLAAGDGSGGFVLNGAEVYDELGVGLAGLGDLNGDGIDDFIVATDNEDFVANQPSQAYVVFGSDQGFPSEFNPSALADGDGSTGFVINGISNVGRYAAVNAAGDINGDGHEDLVIGSPGEQADGLPPNSGVAYVVFGNESGFPPSVDLPSLDGSNGFAMLGIEIGDYAGDAVSGAGDINGDGVDDLVIGASGIDQGLIVNTGGAYVVFGSRQGFPANFPLALLGSGDGTRGFAIRAPVDSFGSVGVGVGSAGDVNDDGVDDVLIGGPFSGSTNGEAYLLYGTTQGFTPVVDLADIAAGDGSVGTVFRGANGERVGEFLTEVGDFNGDSVSDLIISQEDGAYLLLGNPSGFPAEFELERLTTGDGSEGALLSGMGVDRANAVGDVNNDGLADVIVSDSAADVGGNTFVGRTYVVFGTRRAFPGVFALDTLAQAEGSAGFVLEGIDGVDRSGYAIGGVGDINGDGTDDLAIGAFAADPAGQASAGEAYVVYGRPSQVSFSVEGLATLGALCLNLTDPQTVFIPSPGQGLSAEVFCASTAPFSAGEGDELRLIAIGNNFRAQLSGRVIGVIDATANCINLTSGQNVIARLAEDGRWDCAAAGLTLEDGDRVNVVLSGMAQ